MKRIVLSIFAGVVLSACGTQGAPSNPAGPVAKERATAFKAFMPDFSSMKKMVSGEEAFEVEKFKAAAAQFAADAKVPFEHFQSDAQGNGNSLPAVWEKADAFKAEQDKFFEAVDKLNAAAQTGKLEEIKPAFGATGASCKSCHETFRAPI